MHCLACLSRTKVLETRYSSRWIKSRRVQCKECGFRFTTYEIAFDWIEKIQSLLFVRKEILKLYQYAKEDRPRDLKGEWFDEHS